MKSDNQDLIYSFIEANPRCTRKMLMEATKLCKATLGKNLIRMRPMFIVDIELDSRNRPVEHYTINPHYDYQKVAIKEFEPIEFKHHHLFSMYGIA
jgi:hypothetical protein